ncbi:Hypothetical protein GLP15_4881 [Giardia lamblia P15]|uniref:Uncharacterized protein n=1 Tax=Giardia intestinalis (strain P15) TaxID=658858 RepID=E1F4S7_GIAIA|nr:Hypothetical protein GLP15_4881 [Giardia lamblia P15]
MSYLDKKFKIYQESLTNSASAIMPAELQDGEENYFVTTETDDTMNGSTCIIDPSIAVSLHCGSTVDRATCTGELDCLPFLRGTTAVVQTEIALHTKSQCQIYIPIIKQYAKSIAKGTYIYDRPSYHDTVEPMLDPVKLSYDVDVLKEQNEEFLRRIVEMQTEIDKHTRTIYHLALEKQRLVAVEEDLRTQLKQTSKGEGTALPASQTPPFEPPEFVLRDINGDILFDERLLPPDSETLLYVVKGGDKVVTYHIFTDIDEFLSLKKQRIPSRNVKLQIGPSCLHPSIWQ